MQKLIRNWWNKNTIIGKILKFIYDSEVGISENELKEYLEENGYSRAWFSDLAQINKEYKYIFSRSENGITNVRENARAYFIK